MNPALKNREKYAKGTKKQLEARRAAAATAAMSENSFQSVSKTSSKPMNRSQVIAAAKARLAEKKVDPNKKRHAEKKVSESQRKREENYERIRQSRRQRVPSKKKGKGGTVVKEGDHKKEVFEKYVYVKTNPTARELMALKREAAQRKSKYTEKEYEKIKKARLKADRRKKKKPQIIKASATTKKKLVKKGDDEDKYEYEFEDITSESDEIEDDRAQVKFKEVDDKKTKDIVNYGLKSIGPRNAGEKAKVKKEDLDQFTLEDLDPNNKHKSKKITKIVDINKLFNNRILNKIRRDIVLIGPSESTKDSIVDLIMESRIGKKNHVFDTGLEENEDIAIPTDAVALFFDDVPYKPPVKPTDPKLAKTWKAPKIPEYNLKKEYPHARFMCLTKVSSDENVDWHKFHQNTAKFLDFNTFKSIYSEVARYNFLIVDLQDKKIYSMEL